MLVGQPTPAAAVPRPTLWRVQADSGAAQPVWEPGGPVVAAPTPTPLAVGITPTPRPKTGVPGAAPPHTPTPALSPTTAPDLVYVRVLAYWPDDGPDWCQVWDETAARCISPLFSGDDWRGLAGQALACDVRWYGQELDIPGVARARCLDVGETFVCNRNETACTVGLLSRTPLAGDVLHAAYLYGHTRPQPVG